MTRRKTGPDAATVDALYARSGGSCERCGGVGEQIHHRRPRGAGGTRRDDVNGLANLVHVCFVCHSWVESNRDAAREAGWLVRQSADPAVMRVRVQGSWVLLSEAYEFLPGD